MSESNQQCNGVTAEGTQCTRTGWIVMDGKVSCAMHAATMFGRELEQIELNERRNKKELRNLCRK
jgi:hypothetical protein